MKKIFLIVTEDITKTETLSGSLGNLYANIYSWWLNIRLKLIVYFLQNFFNIKVLATNNQFRKHNSSEVLNYDKYLKISQIKQFRSHSWQLVNYIFQQLNITNDNKFLRKRNIKATKLWETYLAIKITHNYLIYFHLIEKIINEIKPKYVLVIGSSIQEKIALYFAKKNSIKSLKLNFLSSSFINKYLYIFFRQREISRKISEFIFRASQHDKNSQKTISSVLLSADFYRHLKTLVPLYNYLRKSKYFPCFVTNEKGMEDSINNFNLENPSMIYLANYLDVDYLNLNLANWKKKSRQLLKKTSKVFFKNIKNDEQFISSLIFSDLTPIITHGLILSNICLEAGFNLFEKIKPEGVIVVSDQRPVEVTLSLLAKKFQVPSILVSPHTVLGADETNRYNTTNKISVTGKYSYRKLLSLGVPQKKLYICGDPSYEYQNTTSKKQLYSQLGIKKLSQKIILLISFRSNPNIPQLEKKEFFLVASRAVEKIKSATLVIKPHPTEKRETLVQEVKKWGINKALISDNNTTELFDLLKYSNAILITWSMTGLEAIMHKIPVVVINTTCKNYDKFIPYVSNGGAVEAKNKEDLIKHLEIFIKLNSYLAKSRLKKAQKFIEEYIQSPDGKVCKRIVSLVTSQQ